MSIWVNVTASANWRQPPFGILRVERNIAQALRDELGEERVRYCVWSEGWGAFIETHAASVSENPIQDPISGEPRCIGTSHALEPRVASRSPENSIGMGLRSYSRRLFHGFKRRIPGGFGRWAARMGVIKAWNRLQPGDVLVTLGLEWETGCMPFLQTLKDRGGIRIIGCCHDLVPIKYPRYCIPEVAVQFPRYLARLTRACDAIACVSECTLRDLHAEIERFDLPLPRLFRIRLGADLSASAGRPSAAVAGLTERPYVLFVSNIERRKNHEVLYRAFHRLAEIHGREILPKLVCVGARGWGVNDLLDDIALDPVTRGIIIQLHEVADDDLCVLYQKALFCVFPSLYEGVVLKFIGCYNMLKSLKR